jgi:hypothetical protein
MKQLGIQRVRDFCRRVESAVKLSWPPPVIYDVNSTGASPGAKRALLAYLFVYDGKDFVDARKRFLFFATRSQMQKGLDWLLEIFPKYPDLHLYVCSQFENEPDFCALYRKELHETPNVHPIGWIAAKGPQYNQLMKTCAYVIHPTCSEG